MGVRIPRPPDFEKREERRVRREGEREKTEEGGGKREKTEERGEKDE